MDAQEGVIRHEIRKHFLPHDIIEVCECAAHERNGTLVEDFVPLLGPVRVYIVYLHIPYVYICIYICILMQGYVRVHTSIHTYVCRHACSRVENFLV
jgi:hypothetical protein